MKYLIASILFLQVFSSCSTTDNNPNPDTGKTTSKNTAPALTEKQMMDAMTEAATPGKEHAALKPLIGEFTTTSKFWYDKSSAPEIVKGYARHTWILGNRFLREDFGSSWQNKPYKGIGHIGYDKTKKKYFSIWIDTSSTGMMVSDGSYDEKNKTFTFDTTYTCPVEGVDKVGKTITKIIDKDRNVFEMYDIGKDGKEFKMMEIEYKRGK